MSEKYLWKFYHLTLNWKERKAIWHIKGNLFVMISGSSCFQTKSNDTTI